MTTLLLAALLSFTIDGGDIEKGTIDLAFPGDLPYTEDSDGCNTIRCWGDSCTSTLRYCGRLGDLVEAKQEPPRISPVDCAHPLTASILRDCQGGVIEERRAKEVQKIIKLLVKPEKFTQKDEAKVIRWAEGVKTGEGIWSEQAQFLDCPEVLSLARSTLIDGLFAVAGGSADWWSTEYALARRPDLRESNPLGISSSARKALKGVTVAGAVAGSYKLRKDGHSKWAAAARYAVLALQLSAAGWNVWQAYHPPAVP